MADQHRVISLDFDDLTIGEIEDFEEHTGIDIEDLYQGNAKMTGRATKVLVWIIERRRDPSFTLDDARNIKTSQLSFPQNRADRRAANAAGGRPKGRGGGPPRRRRGGS